MMKTYLFPGLIVLLAALLLLALPRNNSFRMEPSDVLAEMSHQHFIIDSARLESQLKKGAVLVDIGPGQQFAEDHLSGAVSFPPESWNPGSIRKFFRENRKCVLYAEDLSKACEAWILFTRMGVENLLVYNRRPDSPEGIDPPSFVFTPVRGMQVSGSPEGAGPGD